MILFHKLLPELFLPLGLCLGLLAFGLWRRRRGPLVASLMLLVLASNPLIAERLIRLAEGHAVRVPAAGVPSADAVVVLSAGRVRPPGEPASEWVEADRFFGGLELWRAGKAPRLVFTRPAVDGRPGGDTEGDLLAAQARELGVPADRILLTGPVVNTADEARAAASLLGPGTTVLLVTSAFHMPRARQLFESAGFAVHPFPVDFQVTGGAPRSVMDVLPSATALQTTHRALREFYGRVFYRVFG